MTSQQPSLTELSDDQLLLEIRRLAKGERHATAALLRSLIELDSRRLYLREGCSSLFTYCTQVLRLEEGAAYNRIETARAARRFPSILDHIADGSLTLTAARLLAPHLTPDNFLDVLASARHKSKREVELLVASLHPKPAVPESIRRVPVPPGAPLLPSSPSATATDVAPRRSEGTSSATVTGSRPTIATDCPRSPAVLKPLGAERYKLQFTISRDAHDRLRRVQDLLRHTVGNADLGEIFDRAITSLLTDLERRRCAATSAPRPRRQDCGGSRHIPADVKRAVWKRDAGQCAFIGTSGRCRETGFLEFHHVEPYAAGGSATAENIQLRCRAHNLYEARCFFFPDDEMVREESTAWAD